MVLGFEAPLYVPVPEVWQEIGQARDGEFVLNRLGSLGGLGGSRGSGDGAGGVR